jgi:hypothetical protein
MRHVIGVNKFEEKKRNGRIIERGCEFFKHVRKSEIKFGKNINANLKFCQSGSYYEKYLILFQRNDNRVMKRKDIQYVQLALKTINAFFVQSENKAKLFVEKNEQNFLS